jgi:hypothetical protein
MKTSAAAIGADRKVRAATVSEIRGSITSMLAAGFAPSFASRIKIIGKVYIKYFFNELVVFTTLSPQQINFLPRGYLKFLNLELLLVEKRIV